MKLKIDELTVGLSIVLMVFVGTIRFYINNLIFSNFSLILMISSINFLFIYFIRKKKIQIKSKLFIFYSLFILLISLYNNAYLQDGQYANYMYYVLTIIYAILFSCCDISKKNMNLIFKIYFLFAVLTSIVTWLSLFFPNWYINNVIALLPISSRAEIILNFTKLNCKPGLTSHYSRNAFFIVIGIIVCIRNYVECKNKKNILYIIFFAITSLLVGKRGHITFLLLSIILSYILIKRISPKSLLKLIIYGIIFLLCIFLAVKYIPGANYTYQRFFNTTNDDVSSGRFQMYIDAYNLYKDNGFIPIGFAQYAKSTNYTHPGLHNDYLQILFENGIISLLVILSSNIYFLKKSLFFARIRNSNGVAGLIYILFFLLYSLTGLPHYDVDSCVFYYLMVCLIINEMRATNIKLKEGEN